MPPTNAPGKMSSSALSDEAPVPKKRKTAMVVAPLTAHLPTSMAEVPVMAPMPVLEKAADAPSTALAKKKSSSSSKDKKRKGKSLSDPATATEDPVAKKLKTVDVRTTAAEPPRSSGAAADAIDVARLVAGSKAVQAIATASSACAAMTLPYVLPALRSSLSMLQDGHTDGHALRQPTISNVMPQSQLYEVGSSATSPLIGSSGTKHKRPVINPQKSSTARRFKAPMARKLNSPMVTGSPMMRLLVSPLVVRPRSSALGLRRSPALGLRRSPALGPRRSPSLSPRRSPSRSLQRSPAHSPRRSPALSPWRSPACSPRSGKPRKLRSAIWKDMDPIYQNGKLVRARCKHCYEVFFAARNSGTSHRRRHLDSCEPRLKMHDLVDKLKSSVSNESAILTNWRFDPKVTRCELVRLIVLHELPFSFVEYDGFRSYSASLNPLAETVSRTTIKENCMEAYKNHRAVIREMFEKCNFRFSLTADLWTSNQNIGYMVVTCHYIDDDWKVQKRIIRFCVVKTPHDGVNLYSVILRTIRYYNIEDKLFSITLDNASPNNTMMDILKANLLKMDMLHSDGDLFHIRCAAHVINLIVKDGLGAIDGVINNIRESVRYIRASQSRKENFEDIVVELGISCRTGLSIDIATRWNSTCDMLESAMPYKDAFYELTQKDNNYNYCPSSDEWEMARAVCNLLKVFRKTTEVVSGTTYPTSNLYFHEIWNVKQVLEEEVFSSNKTIVATVLEMQAKFDKYWMISYLANCIPVILDPRFKYGFIEFRLKQAFGDYESVDHLDKVDQAIRRLFNAYSSQMGGSYQVETYGDDMTPTVKGHSWSDWSEHTSAKRSQVNSEYDMYLRDDLFPCNDASFDILNWWKMHTSKYPILASVARDILAVPASIVPSESAFSTSGRVITDHRTRLAGNTVEALLCFQDWLRAAGSSYLDIISIDSLDSSYEDYTTNT